MCVKLLGCFSGTFSSILLEGETSHPSAFHQSCAVRGWTCGWEGVWHRRILGRVGRVDGWSLTHHLDTVRLSVCVHEITRRSVAGHQMLTAGLNHRKLGKGGQSLYSTHSRSLVHLRSTQQTMRVMGDNGADTNKSAPLGEGVRLREQTVCPTRKPKYNTALCARQTEGPVTLTVHRTVSRGTRLLSNDIYTSGIRCG